jgi:N-acetylmuramoyl-L-alanine amidase
MGFAAALLIFAQVPVEEAVATLNARIEIDAVTGIHEISGSGHRVRVAQGLTVMLVDGETVPLAEPAAVRGGSLLLSKEIVAALGTLFLKRGAPPLPAPKGTRPAVKAKVPKSGFKIVIDPGHGGMHTGGKSFRGLLMEKDVTLDISKKLAAALEERGVEVVLTRDRDRHFSENVHEDLDHRVDVTSRAKPDVFLSVHLNWSDNKDAKGFEVYVPRHGGHRAESERLAELIHGEMARRLDTPDRGIKEAGFHVLRNAPCPSTLVELEFLSNPQGERAMMSAEHRGRVAELLCEAIVKYARAKIH